MPALIRKWGNSPALRLPMGVLKEAGFELEQEVELIVSQGRIVIQPAENLVYSLDYLVAGITKENTHDEVAFGHSLVKEAC